MVHSHTDPSEIPDPDYLGFWANRIFQPRKVAEFLDLDRRIIAKFSGVAPTSVRFDERIPRQARDWLTEVAALCNAVSQFFHGDARKTALWFQVRNPMLGDISPREMIRIGLHRKLSRFIVDALREGEGPTTGSTIATTSYGRGDQGCPGKGPVATKKPDETADTDAGIGRPEGPASE